MPKPVTLTSGFNDRSGKAISFLESALYALGSAYVPTMGQFQEPSVTISGDCRVVTLSCSPHFFLLWAHPEFCHPTCRVLITLLFSAGEELPFCVTCHP